MQTAIVKSKSKGDLKLLLELARKIGIDVRPLTKEETEDIGLINAIRKGKTGETVDIGKYLQKLRGE